MLLLFAITLAAFAIACLLLWILSCGPKHAAAFQRRLAHHHAQDRLRAAIRYRVGKGFRMDDAYAPVVCQFCGHRMKTVRRADGRPYGMVCTRIAYFAGKIDFCGSTFEYDTANDLEIRRTAAFLQTDEVRWPPDKA